MLKLDPKTAKNYGNSGSERLSHAWFNEPAMSPNPPILINGADSAAIKAPLWCFPMILLG